MPNDFACESAARVFDAHQPATSSNRPRQRRDSNNAADPLRCVSKVSPAIDLQINLHRREVNQWLIARDAALFDKLLLSKLDGPDVNTVSSRQPIRSTFVTQKVAI